MTTAAQIDAGRRQVLAILSDHRNHTWSDVTAAVAMTHRISQKDVSGLLRHLVRTGEIVRHNPGDREPTVRLGSVGGCQ
jgi:predicted transcriptional regulator